MSYFKTLRKKLKSTFFYNVIQNWLHKPLKSFSDCFGEDLFVSNYFSDLNNGFLKGSQINTILYGLSRENENKGDEFNFENIKGFNNMSKMDCTSLNLRTINYREFPLRNNRN